MGLSNEERITKFYWVMQGWRAKLHDFAERLSNERVSGYTLERTRDVARGWVAQADMLVGYTMRKTNRGGSTYWLLGEADDSLKGLHANPYNLESDAHPSRFALPEDGFESIAWWSANADMEMCARELQGSGFLHYNGLTDLAKWWDLYDYISAVIYPLWRYDDDLFGAAIQDGLTKLVGEMVNRRFEVCFGMFSEDDRARKESYLLLKHRAFHSLLKEEGKKRKGMDYFKKEFDGRALWSVVAKMSAKDMADLFKKESDAKWKWDRKYHADLAEKEKANPKADGLFGPKVPSEDEPVPPKPIKAKRKR